jgi:hypothetical protein
MIKIMNEFSTYSSWLIYEEMDNYYKIELANDRAIITTINKSKIYLKDGILHSDSTIKITQNFKFGFAPFKVITLE